MCFSATASFTAAAGLAALSYVAIRHVRTPSERLLALIPMLFSAQQAVEGLIWLSFEYPDLAAWRYWCVQLFAVFIGLVWPILVPYSIYLLEKNPVRRRLMQAVLLLGVVIAVYTISVIWRFGVRAEITHHSIDYAYAGEDQVGTIPAYFIATCGAFFCSRNWNIRLLGVVNLAGFIVAYYFYTQTLASVWCFFAAIMSGLICLYLRYDKRIEAMLVSR